MAEGEFRYANGGKISTIFMLIWGRVRVRIILSNGWITTGVNTPENCVWATRKEQGRNKRNNRPLTVNGETKPLTQWAEELNIPPHRIYNRLKYGWTHEAALNPSARKYTIKDPIKRALKAGETVPGVVIEEHEHLVRK